MGNSERPDRPVNQQGQVNQWVEGDDNQVVGSVYGGTVINRVEGDVIQQAAKRAQSLFQLPYSANDFTGRAAELDEIYAVLNVAGQGGTVAILAIAGMAGVGKSALAIYAAHQMKQRFADAQLYINLQGADAQPRDPSDVLGEWLRALGMDGAEIPPTLEARMSCYRSLLANKRALVLLDNAHSEAQVRPLLPGGGGCAVVLMNLGSIYNSQNRWEDAISYYQQSLEINYVLGDHLGISSTSYNLGIVYESQGRWDEAIDKYEQSLEVRRSLGDQHGEGLSLANLGYIYQARAQYLKAIGYWQAAQTKLHPNSPEAKQIAQKLKQPYGSIQQRLARCLPYAILLIFAAFNLLRGHWLIATLTLLTFAAFLTYRLWKLRRGHR